MNSIEQILLHGRPFFAEKVQKIEDIEDRINNEQVPALQMGFLYKEYSTIRNKYLQNEISKLLRSVFMLLVVMICAIQIQEMDLKTTFSQNEQTWSVRCIAQFIYMHCGVIVIRAYVLGQNIITQIVTVTFILFETVMFIGLIMIFLEGSLLNWEEIEKDNLVY